jgi:hypothetical protein
VDIEGGEVALLQTSSATMKNLGAKLIIEPHHVNGKLDTQDCCALLISADYSVRVRDKVPGSEALIEAIPQQAIAITSSCGIGGDSGAAVFLLGLAMTPVRLLL